MYRLLLIGMENDKFTKIVNALQGDKNVELDHVDSGGSALASLAEKPVDLAVAAEELTDMSGLAFAAKLVVQNPMVTCALVSSLNKKDFHEVSEGLGILAQLPPEPDASEAASLVKKLSAIIGRNV